MTPSEFDPRQDAEPKRSVRFELAHLSPDIARKTAEEIEQAIRDPENFIDRGGIGYVYRLAGGICLKVMEPRRLSQHAGKMDLGNTPHKEATFLQRLAGLNVDGARVPFCYGFAEASNPMESDAILMEELDAVNLQRAIIGKEPFPETFDAAKFVEVLEAFFLEMHRMGIAHGDVAARNVMIDRQSGLPRVIDFGRAKEIPPTFKKRADDLTDEDWEKFEEISESIDKIFAV